MIDNEQLVILLVLFIGFIGIILFIRFWPFKKEEKKVAVLKYRKLHLLTGEITELNEKELRKDISMITGKGYEMTLLSELFDITENTFHQGKKWFLILNSSEQHHPVELLTQKLVALNANIIFYRPVIVEE